MKIILMIIIMISATATGYGNSRESKKVGDVVFSNPELQSSLNNALRPLETGSLSIDFIDEFVDHGDRFAMVVFVQSRYFERADLPVRLVALSGVKFSKEGSGIHQVIAGAWVKNLLTDEEYQLAIYNAILPFPSDLDVFKNDEEIYRFLPSLNNIATTCYIIKDGSQGRIIRTQGLVKDYGEEAPTKRSETFAKLYEIMDDVWTGDLAQVLIEMQKRDP